MQIPVTALSPAGFFRIRSKAERDIAADNALQDLMASSSANYVPQCSSVRSELNSSPPSLGRISHCSGNGSVTSLPGGSLAPIFMFLSINLPKT
jgi:hypothetical protein